MSVLTNAVIIAFTSDFIPRTLYYFKNNGNLNGYLNSTLSSYNIDNFGKRLKHFAFNQSVIEDYHKEGIHICWYQGNRNPPGDYKIEYQPTIEYWELLTMRLAFVFLFENVITITTMLLRWVIPDVPATLKQNIRQHQYLTSELIMQQELKRAKDLNPTESKTTIQPEHSHEVD